MRPILLALLGLSAFAVAAPAAEPSDILRYVPRQAEFVIVVDRPRQLADALTGLPPLRQLMELDGLKEELTSTNSRRFLQFVAHFEKTLGKRWPDLLDDLAGGGIALAVRFENDPPPAMLVMKARDEAILQKAFAQFIEIATSELERKESTEKIVSQTYRGCPGYQLGPDAFAAIAGPVLFISNKAEAVKLGIDLYINGASESIAASGKPDAAKKLLAGKPLAWTYLDLGAFTT